MCQFCNSFVKVVDPRHSFKGVIKWIILSIVYENKVAQPYIEEGTLNSME